MSMYMHMHMQVIFKYTLHLFNFSCFYTWIENEEDSVGPQFCT